MLIAHVADIHIADSRIEEFKEMLQQLGDSIKSKNPDLIVFPGDMFIHRDKLSQMQVQLTRWFFHEILDGYRILITPGNHDASMAQNKIDSLSAIFTGDDTIPIYSEIGAYVDIEDHRFHMCPYPSKNELVRLGLDDVSEIYGSEVIKTSFNLDKTKKNILLYHGTLEEFNFSTDYKASADAIGVGKEMVMPKSFWSQFDAVMAGHLHKYQAIDKAVYPGCPFPLTYADSYSTGWILWDNLVSEFIELEQLYPYMTVNIGSLSMFKTGATDEAVRRINNDYSYENARVRVKYSIAQSQSGEVDHSAISKFFKDAKEIKIVPQYEETTSNGPDASVSFDDFKDNSLEGIILKHIDEHKFNPQVKDIAKLIETRLAKNSSADEEAGIHFRINTLKLGNFKCFGTDTGEINFDSLDKVVGIFGKNKSGKSSLIEGIVWGLFGTTQRNKIAKSVIKNGEAEAFVELTFTAHKTKYKINRTRTEKGMLLKLYKLVDDSWVDVSGADGRKTQELINKLVGTFDMFVSTVYSPQNHIGLLVNKKPGDRKQIILDCLQIDVLEKRQAEIAEIKKAVKEKVQMSRGKINTLSSQLSDIEAQQPNEMLTEYTSLLRNAKIDQKRYLSYIEDLSKKLFNYTELKNENDQITIDLANLREKVSKIKDQISMAMVKRNKFEAIMADTSVIERGLQRIKEADEQIERYTNEQVKLTNLKDRKTQLEKRVKELQLSTDENVSALKRSLEAMESQISGFQSLNCPRGSDCPLENKISAQKDSLRIKIDEINKTITDEQSKRSVEIEVLKEEIITIGNTIESSFYDRAELMRYVQVKGKEVDNKWHEMQTKIASGEEILSGMTEVIAAYKNQKDSLGEVRDKLIARRTEIADKLATVDGYKREIDTARFDLAEVNKKITSYETQIFKAQRNIEDINKLQKELADEHTALEKKELYLVHCNKYNDIVSKSGVIFSLVDKALPIIEKFAQELLTETTNGTISLGIDSYKVLSSGDKSDDVNIYISDAKGKRDVLEASGAEAVLVSLALRAAMSHLLSLRMGSHVELFIIDEGMGSLDDENIVAVKDIFKRLGEQFNKVLFITHVAELKDIATSIINVESNSLESTFKIVEKPANG